jgi:hypothetical protein
MSTRAAEQRLEQQTALRTQETTEREEGRAAKEEARAQKKEARDERSPIQDIVDYAEVAGLVGLMFLLRKPLKKAVDWVLEKMKKHVEKVEEEAIKAELAAREKVVQTYLLDNIYGPKIGGEMYRQLILNGRWTTAYIPLKVPPPAEMAPQFVVGSGSGRVTLTAEAVHLFAIEAEELFRWLADHGSIE